MSGPSWVIIDDTNGAKCGDGSVITPAAMAHFVEAVSLQLNGEFAQEHGGAGTLRVGASSIDILPGEWVYALVSSLPQAPGASAYHDIDGQGVPAAYCAITTCENLYGSNGVSVDISHEVLETSRDEGCNQTADDGKGTIHACEECDPVEVQTYGKTCADGTIVQVSNFVMRAWFISNARGPYDYMTAAGLPGAVAPPGPMQTAPGNGGNYQITGPSSAAQETTTFAKRGVMGIIGTPRKLEKTLHWSSRAMRRLHRFS